MANLTLPFVASDTTGNLAGKDGSAFEITLTSGGGTALYGASFGTDTYDDTPTGVYGETDIGVGVIGVATASGAEGYSTGVQGIANAGVGVFGSNEGSANVVDQPAGVVGASRLHYGVFGSSDGFDGVKGVSSSPQHAGVSAVNNAAASGQVPSGFGVWASSNNTAVFARGTPAAYFEGDVLVTGDMVLVNQSGDLAEDFDVEAEPLNAEPGTVLVINEKGNLCASDVAYDTRVAGVVAGAGDLRPAVVLQRVPSKTPRSPIALVGKVFCKVDATFGGIVAGDLLTTSPTRGHAMKASDKPRAIGAMVGKALACLSTGSGLIPILVSPR
jgi:hypothetical protein